MEHPSIDDIIEFLDEIGTTPESHFVSFQYNSTKNQPEIKIDGDIPDPEFQNFLNTFIQDMMASVGPQTISTPDSAIEPISLQFKPLESPYYDLIETGNGIDIVLEMPGISTEVVKTTINNDNLQVNATNGTKTYQSQIKLPFTPHGTPTIISNNGIITISVFK